MLSMTGTRAAAENTDPANIFGMDESRFVNLASEMSLKPFQGREIYRWIYRKRNVDPGSWTSLPASFRKRFAARYSLELPKVASVLESRDGTKKFLLLLRDGLSVEAVYIPQNGRVTLCLSTQVGCPVRCAFCLTGKMGFTRNLTPGEIVGQPFVLERECGLDDNSYNVVFMGMGEPLLNLENLKPALGIMTDPDGLGISRRRITVSTIGVRKGLEEYLAVPGMPQLAISLHSASEETRKKLIPAAKELSLKDLRGFLQDASRKNRERISLEYVMLDGINCEPEDARQLARFCSGLKVKVNLIPFNPHPYVDFKKPTQRKAIAFQDILAEMRISSTIRQSRGSDISAACGQLAVFHKGKQR